jgi:gas vesicle protein
MLDPIRKTNGKILMAVLAGTTAGIIAGLLMAPRTGANTRNELKQSALNAKDIVNNAFKKYISQQQPQQGD